MPLSAYIHIPFCAHKCDFCDFAVVVGLEARIAEYCATVASEISARCRPASASPLETVYYGGGTPGYIPAEQLAVIHEALKRHVGVAADAEVTIETTPKCVTETKARLWRQIGVNRISIGVESLSDAELSAVGRGESAGQARAAISTARQAGFDNVSCDLMYGLPTQTQESWTATLNELTALPVEHISAYGLTLAERSPLKRRFPDDSPDNPGEELFAQMYERLVTTLDGAGFSQYEISNFSRPGFASRHNLRYWQNDEYLAFGLSAHRYVGSVRSANYRSFSSYMSDPLGAEFEEVIDADTCLREGIFLALRTRAGLDPVYFSERYGVDVRLRYREVIERLSQAGLLEQDGDGWLRLTQKGVLVSNLAMSEFM